MMTSNNNENEGGDGQISGKQEAYNRKFNKRLEEHDAEIQRLQ